MRDPLGSVAVLNVGAGDLKLSFDPKNPAELKKAAGIVKDMLAREQTYGQWVGNITHLDSLIQAGDAPRFKRIAV